MFKILSWAVFFKNNYRPVIHVVSLYNINYEHEIPTSQKDKRYNYFLNINYYLIVIMYYIQQY